MHAAWLGTTLLLAVASYAASEAWVTSNMLWAGAITPDSAVLAAYIPGDQGVVDIALWQGDKLGTASEAVAVWMSLPADQVIKVRITGLAAETEYSWSLVRSTAPSLPSAAGQAVQTTYPSGTQVSYVGAPASFRTFPAGPVQKFRLAAASCAWADTTFDVFDKIVAMKPDFMIHMGDLVYADYTDDNDAERVQTLREAWTAGTENRLLRSTGFAYMVSDHDATGNGAVGTDPGMPSVQRAYQLTTPHYPMGARVSGTVNDSLNPAFDADTLALSQQGVPSSMPRAVPLYQAFTIGTDVRVIITDLRTNSRLTGSPDSTLGPQQLAWFKAQLDQWAQYSIVIWVCTKPYQGLEVGSDRWGGFAAEREDISNHIAALGITNLIGLAGDAHMLGIDDGSHTDYATNGGAGFTLMQAAPMVQAGSVKIVGPMSHGCFGYAWYTTHQWGIVDIERTGSDVCVTLTGYNAEQSDPLTTYTTCNTFSGMRGEGPAVEGKGGCKIQMFPGWVWTVLYVFGVTVALWVLSVWLQTALHASAKHSHKHRMAAGWTNALASGRPGDFVPGIEGALERNTSADNPLINRKQPGAEVEMARIQ